MEAHTYSVKGKSQIYNDNIKRPKSQDIWLRLVSRLHANTSIPDVY